MMKIRNVKSRSQLPQVSTASLPDIVFILLFFFMTVTVMRNTDYLVENSLPKAQEVEGLPPQDRVIEIVVGQAKPKLTATWGDQPKVQLNGKLTNVDEVGSYVLSELHKMPEYLRKVVTISLKIDKRVNMGIVSDIKEELKRVNVFKIHYVTNTGQDLQ